MISTLFYHRIFYGLLALLSLIPTVGNAQSELIQNSERTGDQYFMAAQYFRAAQYYQLALKRDSSNHQLALKLAHSERRQFNYTKALKWYQYAQNVNVDFFPEAAYYQSLMLKAIGGCERAYPWLDSLLRSPSPEARKLMPEAEQLRLSCLENDLTAEKNQEVSVVRLDSTVNSPNYDYAPLTIANDSVLILTSTRFAGKQKVSYRFGENNANFFSYRRQEEGFVASSTFASTVNTKASEGAGCYVDSQQEFYFTYCSDNQPCKIYFIASEGDDWSAPKALPPSINLEKSETKHPSVSASGDTLFFASDRSGGRGGMDIWMSVRTGKNQWLSPVCLDSTVNSAYDEVTPYYFSSEDHLYFASDDQRGYGGMDLYVILDFSSSSSRTRTHLPQPINSSADDSYLVLGHHLGYLASNRGGNFDIYLFEKPANQAWLPSLLGIPSIANEVSDNPVSTVSTDRIRRTDFLESEINDWIWVNSAQQKRLGSGATRFILNSDVNDIQMRQYQAEQQRKEEAKNVEVVSRVIEPNVDSTLILATFFIDSAQSELVSVVSGEVAVGERKQPFAEQTIELRDGEGNLLKTSTTNADGKFRFVNLPNNNAYAIALASTETPDTVKISALQFSTEPEYRASQTFEPIYFNFNQQDLRPEATKVLDALADFYRTNSEISIEINAFTDSLGNDIYNLLLSKQRGEAAFEYLINSGVDRSALAINANGVSTAYTSTNAYVSQQLNRRVEFEIFGLDRSYESEVSTRILRPNIDLTRLLEDTEMTWEELASLNGRPLDILEPYKPIRVYKDKINDSNALFYRIIDIN